MVDDTLLDALALGDLDGFDPPPADQPSHAREIPAFATDTAAPPVVDPERVTLAGTVARVRFRGDRGFGVVELRLAAGGRATVVGTLPDLAVGDPLEAAGRWEPSPYGRQLRAETAGTPPPTTGEGLVACLGALVDGFGPGLARTLLRGCGGVGPTLVWLAGDAPVPAGQGLGPHAAGLAGAVRTAWRSRAALREAELALASLGLLPGVRLKLLAAYGATAHTVAAADPYALADTVDGIGWTTADAIARAHGVAATDPRRTRAALRHALQAEAEQRGHTYATRAQAADAMARLLGTFVASEMVDDAAKRFVARGTLTQAASGALAPTAYVAAERAVAEAVVARAFGARPLGDVGLVREAEEAAGLRLGTAQRIAIDLVRQYVFAIVTGGPGTGKTTITKAIVAMMRLAGVTLALCSPTGRAAKRLTEATGEPALTIHRLLEPNPHGGGDLAFLRTAENPLEADVVLVDEASMVDVELMAALVAALRPAARLVLVGDANQLPPVGPGAPFRDLCARPDLPRVVLDTIHRQAQGSQIVHAAHAILRGQSPEPSPPRDRSDGCLFRLTEDDDAALAADVVQHVQRLVPQTFGVAAADVMVIAPMRGGTLGVTALNAALQAALNPRPPPEVCVIGEGTARREYRVGDRVMVTKNDYQRGVVNGDLGTVVATPDEDLNVPAKGRVRVVVAFPDPGCEGGARRVAYSRMQLATLDLAYASTVHKVQGAEFPAVVVVIHAQHAHMLERALLYTAVTRAKRVCLLLGSATSIKRAVRTARRDERRTMLPGMLTKLTAGVV